VAEVSFERDSEVPSKLRDNLAYLHVGWCYFASGHNEGPHHGRKLKSDSEHRPARYRQR